MRQFDRVNVKLIAMEYCLFHYPMLYTAGTPYLCTAKQPPYWLVPIVLATPSSGVLGEVGELHVDVRSGKITSASDRSEVIARGAELYRAQGE